MADLNTRSVLAYGLAQTVFNRALVTNRRHINEVDYNQTAEVAQTQLTRNFIGCFKVGVERCFFDVAAAGCACGVDIDSGQCFSAVDND